MTVDFEARYRADSDPWGYTTSDYERAKYDATLAACRPGSFSHALELGGSIGVFSARLAPHCVSLETIDVAPTAVIAARGRLAAHPHAHARLGTIPDDLPDGPFDLVVASEILYYLDAVGAARTIDRVTGALAPGGRIVAVHWRPLGPERPLSADLVHDALRGHPTLRPVEARRHPEYLLDVLVRA